MVWPWFSKVSISCFISINLNLEKPFFAVLREFSRVFTRCWNFQGCSVSLGSLRLIIGGVEHVATFEALFRECLHELVRKLARSSTPKIEYRGQNDRRFSKNLFL